MCCSKEYTLLIRCLQVIRVMSKVEEEAAKLTDILNKLPQKERNVCVRLVDRAARQFIPHHMCRCLGLSRNR